MAVNRLNTEIPQEVITQVSEKFKEIKELLAPYTENLSTEEKRSLAKMSDKTLAFVSKVVEYTNLNPKFIPAVMKKEDLQQDFRAHQSLTPLSFTCEQLAGILKDTLMIAGHEAYKLALLYYGSIKLAAKAGDTEAKTIFDNLSKRFPKGKSAKETSKDGDNRINDLQLKPE
jgi:hypothetical protein